MGSTHVRNAKHYSGNRSKSVMFLQNILFPFSVIKFMARRRNSVSGLKISSLSETWWLCRWLCKVHLRTSNVYIFKQYFILPLNRSLLCDSMLLK